MITDVIDIQNVAMIPDLALLSRIQIIVVLSEAALLEARSENINNCELKLGMRLYIQARVGRKGKTAPLKTINLDIRNSLLKSFLLDFGQWC